MECGWMVWRGEAMEGGERVSGYQGVPKKRSP
jgi:hypothetical protein